MSVLFFFLYNPSALLSLLFAVALGLTDLQGYWINAPYADALAKSRSPLQAERIGTPLSMRIAGDRAEITTYHEASWRRIVSVTKTEIVASPLEDPDGTPEHIPLAGNRDRIFVALWPHTRVSYRRLDVDADTYARRVVMAGTYKDKKGTKYVFAAGGQMTIDDGAPQPWRIALDTSEACCDYFYQGEADTRIGFRWKEGKLLLFHVILDPKGCPISCEKKPYAVLTPTPETSRPPARSESR